MHDDDSGETGRRMPGARRLITAAALLALAGVVLWTTVAYSTRDDTPAVAAEDTPAAVTGSIAMPVQLTTGEPASPGYPAAPAPSVSSGRPVPSPSASPPSSPSRKATATAPASSSPSPAKTTAAKTFKPVSVQAEAGSLSGGAAVVACGTCDGGARVRYVGRVEITVDVAVAGARTVTVSYEADGTRSLAMSVNGSSAGTVEVSGTSWTAPQTTAFTTVLPAGTVVLGFSAGTGNAPDLDRIDVR
ncbi:MAG TPA: hypothetical protein VN408_24925 [Actinoplanes sp.]|nr:hypothetical protein [Actinoplanes sp.]